MAKQTPSEQESPDNVGESINKEIAVAMVLLAAVEVELVSFQRTDVVVAARNEQRMDVVIGHVIWDFHGDTNRGELRLVTRWPDIVDLARGLERDVDIIIRSVVSAVRSLICRTAGDAMVRSGLRFAESDMVLCRTRIIVISFAVRCARITVLPFLLIIEARI